MKESLTFDRKFFLKITAIGLTLISGGLLFPLTDKLRIFSTTKKKIEINGGFSDGISFFGDVIAFKNADRVKIFSSRCPHLGCIIKNLDSSGNPACACHGSVFSTDGKVISGPSSSDLKELKWQKDSKSGKIVIEDASF